MILPEEIVASRVLPTFRAMVAERLSQKGLRERAIADRLQLTQSAVSKYLRGRIRRESIVERSGTFRALADGLAEGLADGSVSSFEAMGRLMAAIQQEERRGLVCRLHEERMPSLVGLGCDLCVRGEGSESLAEEEVLGDLRLAVRMLESMPRFARLIPNVASNLARAKQDASSRFDVAAIPGRIFEMRGSVRVPAAPEFGPSRHVAETLLAVREVYPAILAAINIRWNEDVMAVIRAVGWTSTEFDATYEGRRERISEAVRRHDREPRVLYHRGSFGIEPIAYVLDRTATALVEQMGDLLNAFPKFGGAATGQHG
ncbi:MAG: thiamine-phosphate synthase family protein [Thermoplasmata archaeon]